MTKDQELATLDKTNFTPGPWEGAPTGEVTRGYSQPIGVLQTNTVNLGLPTCEANARLIAAAPELLKALRRCLPWIGKMIADGAHLNSVAPNDCIGAMQQAQAAVIKATL